MAATPRFGGPTPVDGPSFDRGGLPSAVIPADVRIAREVPYAFARDHHVLVARRDDADVHGKAPRIVFIGPSTSPLAIAELQRALGPVRIVEVGREALEKAIAKGYATDDGAARRRASSTRSTRLSTCRG